MPPDKKSNNTGPDAWLKGEVVGSKLWREILSPASKEVYLQLCRYSVPSKEDKHVRIARMSLTALKNLTGYTSRMTLDSSLAQLKQYGLIEMTVKPRHAINRMLGVAADHWWFYIR